MDLFFEKNINKLHISFISKIMMCLAILCCHSDIKDAFKKMYSMRILCTQCEKGMMLCTHGAGCGMGRNGYRVFRGLSLSLDHFRFANLCR